MLINLSSKLSRVIVLRVHWAILRSDPDWPVEPPFNITNLDKVFATLHFEQQVLLLQQNDDILRGSDDPSIVYKI